MKKVILIIIAVLLVGGGIIGFIVANKNKDGQQEMTKRESRKTGGSPLSRPFTMTNTVTIEDSAFNPAGIAVKPGTTVTWTNKDSVKHTVTVTGDYEGPKSKQLSSGETYSYIFNKAVGPIYYHCELHPAMEGGISVSE